MSESIPLSDAEKQDHNPTPKKFEYIDKNGQPHFFETSEQLMDFRDEENRPENR